MRPGLVSDFLFGGENGLVGSKEKFKYKDF